MKPWWAAILMRTIEQYFHVVMFVFQVLQNEMPAED